MDDQSIKRQNDVSMASNRTCKGTVMLLILSFFLLLTSCSSYKKIAYNFVKKSKGASVAFYVPSELVKTNLRRDCNPSNTDLVELDANQLQDTINSRIKIINKIDDEIFLSVMIASFEETLKDYGLTLEYWEKENTKPDSLHWVVDLSHLEIQEFNEYLMSNCGVDGNYEFFTTTAVNVASWIELSNDDVCELRFTEQNYSEYIIDCNYYIDSTEKWAPFAEIQHLTLDGFYDFAVILGKLYAGYSYDFFMNEYVRKKMHKKGLEYSDDVYMRYDPYESYIYYTGKDKFIEL